MDSIVRCYTCTEIGHIAKNCMNIGKIEDEKKAKVDNIKKQMRQQWIPRPLRKQAQIMKVMSLKKWVTLSFQTKHSNDELELILQRKS